jgi:hypothetical protein
MYIRLASAAISDGFGLEGGISGDVRQVRACKWPRRLVRRADSYSVITVSSEDLKFILKIRRTWIRIMR